MDPDPHVTEYQLTVAPYTHAHVGLILEPVAERVRLEPVGELE